MLFVFPHEHNSNSFLLSAIKSMNVKEKLRILSCYFKKTKSFVFIQILLVKFLPNISLSNYKLNITNNAQYVIRYIYRDFHDFRA
jgi:hypothetical protein